MECQDNNNLALHGGSLRDRSALEGSESDNGLKLYLQKKEDGRYYQSDHRIGSAKWVPFKRRMIYKMMNSVRTSTEAAPTDPRTKFKDQELSSSPMETDYNNTINNSSNNPIRVCSDCNTTKTPLWRSGPSGPKSLCNACGIRRRKARRAVAAAAPTAAANGTFLAAETPSPPKIKVQHKVRRSKNCNAAQQNNGSKLATPSHGRKKNCFEDFLISLSEKYLAFHQVFPQDEKEAAILLMALSCGGLIHG
ncbi:hypothetical protein U1Q18_028718 [Sarracenia purpurea var. burkii]